MSDFTYALGAGLLGGIAGYAQGNIDDKTEANKEAFQRERDDAAAKRQIDAAKAADQIRADREALIKEAQAKSIQSAYRASTTILPTDQQNQQTQMMQAQGGADMMPLEDDYAQKRSEVTGRGMLTAGLSSGNADAINAGGALIKQESEDAKTAANISESNAKAGLYNTQTEMLNSGRTKNGASATGSGLAQEKFSHTLSREEKKDRADAIDTAYARFEKPVFGEDGKPKLDANTDIKMQKIYATGITSPAEIAIIAEKYKPGTATEGAYKYETLVDPETGKYLKVGVIGKVNSAPAQPIADKPQQNKPEQAKPEQKTVADARKPEPQPKPKQYDNMDIRLAFNKAGVSIPLVKGLDFYREASQNSKLDAGIRAYMKQKADEIEANMNDKGY